MTANIQRLALPAPTHSIFSSGVSRLLRKSLSIPVKVRIGDLQTGKLTGASAFQILQRTKAGDAQDVFQFLRSRLGIKPNNKLLTIMRTSDFGKLYGTLLSSLRGEIDFRRTITVNDLIKAVRDDWPGFVAARASFVTPKTSLGRLIESLKGPYSLRHRDFDFPDGVSHLDLSAFNMTASYRPPQFKPNEPGIEGFGLSAFPGPKNIFFDLEAIEAVRERVRKFLEKNPPVIINTGVEESDGADSMVRWNDIGRGDAGQDDSCHMDPGAMMNISSGKLGLGLGNPPAIATASKPHLSGVRPEDLDEGPNDDEPLGDMDEYFRDRRDRLMRELAGSGDIVVGPSPKPVQIDTEQDPSPFNPLFSAKIRAELGLQ